MYGLGSLLFGKKINYDSDNESNDTNSDIDVNNPVDYDIESASFLSEVKIPDKNIKTFVKPDISISTSGSFTDFDKINKPIIRNDSLNSTNSINSTSGINYKNTDTPKSTPSGTPINNSNKVYKSTDAKTFFKNNFDKYIKSSNELEPNELSKEDSKDSCIEDVKLYNKKLQKINKWRTNSDDYEIGGFVDDEQSDSDKETINYDGQNDINNVNNEEYDKISYTSSNSKSSLSKNKEDKVEPDHFGNYIIEESKSTYNHNSYYCQFLWSGIEHLDHWELQRKVTKEHAKQILIQMKKDYKTEGKFTFYDVVHLGIKPDGKYYVIDGQHRLVAYYNLFFKNQYPIQRVPAVIWETKTDDEFLEIYERINKRVPFDVTPFSKKILDIMFQMENHFGKDQTIWGKKRPKIDKILFVEEMKTNDDVHKLDADTIVKKIIDINIKIRGLPRSKRGDGKITSQVHTSAENIDFFLGYDKALKWIHDIKQK